MIDYLYLYLFLGFLSSSIFYILLMSSHKGEISRFLNITNKIRNPKVWTLLKVIPTLLVIFGAFLYKNDFNNSIFYLGIVLALIFCLFGDIAIEKSFINGMIFFSFAHIFFILTFIFSFTRHVFYFDNFSVIFVIIFIIFTIFYNVIFLKFLNQGGKLGKLQSPVKIYSGLISIVFVLAASVVYFMNLNDIAILIPFGALLFIISDSLIAIREFHTIKLKYSVAMIMGTYYAAIFFLSFSTLIL